MEMRGRDRDRSEEREERGERYIAETEESKEKIKLCEEEYPLLPASFYAHSFCVC